MPLASVVRNAVLPNFRKQMQEVRVGGQHRTMPVHEACFAINRHCIVLLSGTGCRRRESLVGRMRRSTLHFASIDSCTDDTPHCPSKALPKGSPRTRPSRTDQGYSAPAAIKMLPMLPLDVSTLMGLEKTNSYCIHQAFPVLVFQPRNRKVPR